MSRDTGRGGHTPAAITPNPRATTVPTGPAPGAPLRITTELGDAEALAAYQAETRRLRDAIDAEADYHDENGLHRFAERLREILGGQR